MKKALFCLNLLFSLSAFSSPETALKPLAYVYSGIGLCSDCAESVMHSLQAAGFETRPIYAGEMTLENLSSAVLFAIPGGDGLYEARSAISEPEVSAIREYIENGGHFLGICLGAFLTDHLLVNDRKIPGLGLFDGVVNSHSPTEEARMEKILWRDQERWIYFQDGPDFSPSLTSKVDVWATYDNGAIAALQVPLGKGRLGLIGPHPEAESRWLKEDDLTDPDGSDSALLVAFVKALVESTNVAP